MRHFNKLFENDPILENIVHLGGRLEEHYQIVSEVRNKLYPSFWFFEDRKSNVRYL
jgi:hypothetical protein